MSALKESKCCNMAKTGRRRKNRNESIKTLCQRNAYHTSGHASALISHLSGLCTVMLTNDMILQVQRPYHEEKLVGPIA